jgi:hypothetical protein
MISVKNFLAIVFLNLFIFTACKTVPQTIMLSDDGTWCWFSDPRAIVTQSGDLLTGFVTEDGSVASIQYNRKTTEKRYSVFNEKLEVDDHNNPAFLQRNDGHLLAFYTEHHRHNLYMNVSVKPNDASRWEPAVAINPNGGDHLEKYGDNKYTYANPIELANEKNRIYLFGRWLGFKPNISWSDDGGKTWAESKVVVANEPFTWQQRPYVKYYSDGKSKIHMVFTDGHPRDERFNSVYYAYYEKGAFYRANGELICTIDSLPFETDQATMVYDASITGHRAWVFDVYANAEGNPAIAYALYPTENVHIYHYTWFDGEKWSDLELVNSGKWFPQTPAGRNEREPHYSGGLTISPTSGHELFISLTRNNVFEIEKWELDADKSIWKTTAITQNSTNHQVRPYAIKNSDKTMVLWNAVERYVHYTDYKTKLMMYVE